jgi:hypothetical protein
LLLLLKMVIVGVELRRRLQKVLWMNILVTKIINN